MIESSSIKQFVRGLAAPDMSDTYGQQHQGTIEHLETNIAS